MLVEHLAGLEGVPLAALGEPRELGVREPREEHLVVQVGKALAANHLRGRHSTRLSTRYAAFQIASGEMGDEDENNKQSAAKADHEPPARRADDRHLDRRQPFDRVRRERGLDRPAQEGEAGGGDLLGLLLAQTGVDRPLTFVFNGGPGASSAFLHMGAVGPSRVAFPADGTLPRMPPRLVANEDSWLAFTDLVFVDPVGTGFSRVIENDGKDGRRARSQGAATDGDAKEYFGYKRDLESLCEFMGRWLSGHDRWGSAVFIAGESYGGYRVGRLVRMLQETTGIGLSGAMLISPALEFGSLLADRLRRARVG